MSPMFNRPGIDLSLGDRTQSTILYQLTHDIDVALTSLGLPGSRLHAQSYQKGSDKPTCPEHPPLPDHATSMSDTSAFATLRSLGLLYIITSPLKPSYLSLSLFMGRLIMWAPNIMLGTVRATITLASLLSLFVPIDSSFVPRCSS